jgi:signal transduction histidine kinase
VKLAPAAPSEPASVFLESAPSPMAATAGARHILTFANPAFLHLIDKPLDQLIGKPFCEAMPDMHDCVALLDRVYLSGQPEKHTEQPESKSDLGFWSYRAWPVLAKGHPVGIVIQVTETADFHEMTLAMNEALVLGSLRQHELTEAADASNDRLQKEIVVRKRTEETLHRAQAELSDHAGELEGLVAERTSELTSTNQQLEAFVYSIAHDLRAPLRAMQGFSELLMEEAGQTLSDAGKGYANRISKSAQFMDALLCDLLAFSRVSQRRVELQAVSLESVVTAVTSRLQATIHEKNARVECPGPWPNVLAHESTLSQVVFNLASNALKFSRPGVPPLVWLRTEERAQLIRVWVEDNGVGIAPAHQEQIFRLFTRLNGEKYPGTGIGLAIVQKGVERMGGSVGVESEPQHGSHFWFELRKADLVPIDEDAAP